MHVELYILYRALLMLCAAIQYTSRTPTWSGRQTNTDTSFYLCLCPGTWSRMCLKVHKDTLHLDVPISCRFTICLVLACWNQRIGSLFGACTQVPQQVLCITGLSLIVHGGGLCRLRWWTQCRRLCGRILISQSARRQLVAPTFHAMMHTDRHPQTSNYLMTAALSWYYECQQK